MKTYKLGKIELVNIDLSPHALTWDKVEDLIYKFDPNGKWRLPTVKEFRYLYKLYNLGICKFSPYYYWTFDVMQESRYTFDFVDGIEYLDDDEVGSYNRVRLVRDIF